MSVAKPKTTTTTSTPTTNTSRNLNVQDTAGITVVDSVGAVINTSDFGALENAAELATLALDGAREANRNAADLGFYALDTAGQFAAIGSEHSLKSTDQAFEFAAGNVDTVLNHGLNYFTESLDFANDQTARTFSAGSSLFDRMIDAATSALGASQSQVGSTVSALQSIAKEQTTSDSARLQQVTLYALAAVAIIVIFGARARG